jgi:hypothetical protein
MSNLLSQASLVMIPSGYKEDIVYSAVPTDGSGDLSFTRASNGTRINSAGLVEVTPWNLLNYSEDFSNAYWSKDVGASVDSNVATAPNGTTTADRLNFAGAGQAVYTIQSFGGENTFSVYLKGEGANIGKQIYLEVGVTSTVTLTGEWQRFEVVANSAASVAIKRNTSGQASAVLAWGIQMNIGALKPYFPTTDRLNVPRLTYQNGGGGCPSLLLEKQSTNLATYSEQIDNAVWTKGNATVNANASASPDGTSNADKVIPSTSVAFHNITNSLILTIGTVYTISAFAKADGYNYVAIGNGFGTRQALFNLSNGEITTVTSSTTAEIKNYGNGWYRCSITFETTNTTNQLQITVDNGSGAQYAGNGTSGALIWGAQVEVSSYATSYIPTTSSSATRVADACFKTGISSLIGQTEGVIYIDVLASGQNVAGTTYAFFYLFGDATNNLQLYYISGVLYIYVVVSSSVVINTSTSQTITSNTRYKMALAYKSGQYAFYVNGVQIYTSTASAVPAMSQFNFNSTGFGAVASETENKYNALVLFPTRLTNAELASLTTI